LYEQKWLIDTLTFTPYTKQINQYSISGKLKRIIDVSALFDYFGQKHLCSSIDGMSVMLSQDEGCDAEYISLIRLLPNENKELQIESIRTEQAAVLGELQTNGVSKAESRSRKRH